MLSMVDFAQASPAKHKSVLLHESLEGLKLDEGKLFIDATFGGGGHTREALRRFPGLRTIGLDRDPDVAKANPGFDIRTLNFAEIDALDVRPDAILMDLGFSSDQLENSGKGLSFLKEEPLDMRLSGSGFTAADILNSWESSAIELILRGFGEERYAARIAKEVAKRRLTHPFRTTTDLVQAIEAVVPGSYRHGRIHPATRTFQALRIAVNEELPSLEKALAKGFEMLREGGRLAVISFHSLEDRIVKNFFREKARAGEAVLVTKKPIVPAEAEVLENPRSRSAKLRIIEKS